MLEADDVVIVTQEYVAWPVHIDLLQDFSQFVFHGALDFSAKH